MTKKKRLEVRPWRGEPIKKEGWHGPFDCFGNNEERSHAETHCKVCDEPRPNWSNYPFFGETFIGYDGIEYVTMHEAFCDKHVPESWKRREEA